MAPTRCKHEHEISAAIERWEEKYCILKEEGEELESPDSWKMIAIPVPLRREIQKHIEDREQDLKTCEELRPVVMKWAINRNIKKTTHQGRSDGLNQADGKQSEEDMREVHEAATSAAAEDPEADANAWSSTQEAAVHIDYYTQKGKAGGNGNRHQGGKGPMIPMQMILTGIRKTKGGGKPALGKSTHQGNGGAKGHPESYKCGKQGLIARYCPNTTGQDQRTCRRCGTLGRTERDCRSAPTARKVEEEGAINWACVVASPQTSTLLKTRNRMGPPKSVRQLNKRLSRKVGGNQLGHDGDRRSAVVTG